MRLGDVLLVAALIGSGGLGYKIANDRCKAATATSAAAKAAVELDHVNDVRSVEHKQSEMVATIDDEQFKKLEQMQAEIVSLRRDLADGSKRLHVNATCANNVPNAASSANVDHDRAVRFGATVEQDYIDLRSGLIKQRQQLIACQSILKGLIMNDGWDD